MTIFNSKLLVYQRVTFSRCNINQTSAGGQRNPIYSVRLLTCWKHTRSITHPDTSKSSYRNPVRLVLWLLEATQPLSTQLFTGRLLGLPTVLFTASRHSWKKRTAWGGFESDSWATIFLMEKGKISWFLARKMVMYDDVWSKIKWSLVDWTNKTMSKPMLSL